jgi:hypothetical protein
VDATFAEAAETFNVIVFFKDFSFSKSTAVRGYADTTQQFRLVSRGAKKVD